MGPFFKSNHSSSGVIHMSRVGRKMTKAHKMGFIFDEKKEK
jgi:hypothetical protein